MAYERRFPHLTFRPGLFMYACSIGCVAVGIWLLARSGDGQTDRLPLALAALVVGPVILLWNLKIYRLDDEGIQIVSLFGRRGYRWTDIGEQYALGPGRRAGSRPGTFASRHDVRGTDGRHLFRLSPWTAGKKQLAAEIRRRATAARKLAAR